MKYVSHLNEASDQWRVKDVIEMQKAHNKVLNGVGTLNRAIENLEKLSKKNAKKPNGKVFVSEVDGMLNAFELGILSTKSKFWKSWEEFKKAGKAAFPNDWN
jgi:hypothetical protein